MNNLTDNNIAKRGFDFTGIGLIIIVVVLGTIPSLTSPHFLSVNNLFNILLSVTVIGIAAVGQTLVIVSGGLDLSIEPIIAGTGVIVALMNQQGYPLGLSILLGILLGPIIGLLNGILITKVKINAVIVTLATMSIVRGFSLLISNAKTIPFQRADFGFIGRGYLFETIPLAPVLLILVYIIFFLVLNYTGFGRNIYAVGGNAEAARLAGINVDRYRIIIYTISGTLGSMSGLLFAAITGAGLPYGGQGYILTIIAAVILGGTSLAGGIGKIQGTLLGVLIIGMLNNGLILLDIKTFWQMIITGFVLIIAVAVDQIKLR